MVSQIDLVPEDTVVNLETISEKLKGAVNFNIWNQRIDRELQMDDLQNLIDSSIPRPSPENPRYDIWRKASKRVGNWLTKQLDNNMFEKLGLSPTPTVYADETYDAIKRLATGSGLEDFANSYLLATSMKREDFGTIEQYVNAFRQAVQNANRQEGMSIQPLAASLLLLRGLQDDLPIWVTTIKHDISKTKNPGKMTEEELLALYEKAVDQGRNRERSYVSRDKIISPPQKALQLQSNLSQGFQSPQSFESKRKSPPKGMSPWKWVEEWLKDKQRTDEGQCSFCEYRRHDCKDCFYLIPKKRPENWNPFPLLWCYNDGSQPTDRITLSTTTKITTEQSSPDQQAKMAVSPEEDNLNDDDENVFVMERSLGYMTVEKQFLHSGRHEKEFASCAAKAAERLVSNMPRIRYVDDAIIIAPKKEDANETKMKWKDYSVKEHG